jgi:hypothetical protein
MRKLTANDSSGFELKAFGLILCITHTACLRQSKGNVIHESSGKEHRSGGIPVIIKSLLGKKKEGENGL